MIFEAFLAAVHCDTKEYAIFVSLPQVDPISPRGILLCLIVTIAVLKWFSFRRIWTLLALIERHDSIVAFR